jgi:2-dehydropantoate 2-reductase
VTRVVVVGAGALGSVVGGLLAHSGEDVVLLAHGEHAAALARGPLELRLPGETLAVDVEVAAEAEGDVVVLTAKRFDSGEALAAVRGAPQLAISLQNGPGKDEELAARFGPGPVAGAASTMAAQLVEPGVVASQSLGLTYLDGGHPRGAAFAETLQAAGIEARAVDRIESVEWSKLAHVAGSMLLQALTRLPLHELFERPESAGLLHRVIQEVGAVAAAAGFGLDDWPGLLPVATLAGLREEAAAALLAERGEALRRSGATELRTSMLTSILAGRPTELEPIHGGLVRAARGLGVPIPVLETGYRLALLAPEATPRPGRRS